MADDSIKLPWVKVELPKPKRWDLAAALTMILAIGAVAANLFVALDAPPGKSMSGALTTGFALLHLALATAGLLVLGKTAKEGTLWGNLAAVAALLIGTSGVLLAGALWSAA